MTPPLITPQEFSTYRDISKKRDDEKITELIRLAQDIDLYDVLGGFYFDVLENASDPAYKLLMDGGVFVVDDKNYRHSGLKDLISDYTYARYIYFKNTNDTAFGLQQKYTQDSNAVDRNTIKDIAKQTQIDASIKFQMIDKYLINNKDIFDRYKSEDNPNINTFSTRFSVI